MNPFNNKRFSSNYYRLLAERQHFPVYEARSDILRHLRDNQVIVLEGETGCGKTTQVPQLLVEAGYADDSKIVCCTQPRRVAATSVARRVAEQMDVQLGQQVGYTIRFDNRTSHCTLLKYLTDGMLLREAMHDNTLSRYSVVVLDEAHERTVNTDIVIGLLKGILKKRDDFKVIIMSATMDADIFLDYFEGPPLLKIPGRTFPVQITYKISLEPTYVLKAVETAVHIHQTQKPGDVLVFLTGQDEIEECMNRITKETKASAPVVVLPLYASLSQEEQSLVFKKFDPLPGYSTPPRKIICATMIAETSLTIDGVVYVVDTGFSKQISYDPSRQMESLLVKPISKASAKQRAGRAGRTQPGICYRLGNELWWNKKLKPSISPEILSCNLSTVVLNLKRIGFHDINSFEFIESPLKEVLDQAVETLTNLGALDDDGYLTDLGSSMADFPLGPESAACLINSQKYGCTADVLSIVSMLSSGQFWSRRVKNNPQCAIMHRELESSEGDHFTLLNVFNEYVLNMHDDEWCDDHFVNKSAVAKAYQARQQLSVTMAKIGLTEVTHSEPNSKNHFDAIKKSFLSGFFQQVAKNSNFSMGKMWHYVTCENQQATIHPSCRMLNHPEWVMYHSFMATKKPYIRTVTGIEGKWLKELAPRFFDRKDLDKLGSFNTLRFPFNDSFFDHVNDIFLGQVISDGDDDYLLNEDSSDGDDDFSLNEDSSDEDDEYLLGEDVCDDGDSLLDEYFILDDYLDVDDYLDMDDEDD